MKTFATFLFAFLMTSCMSVNDTQRAEDSGGWFSKKSVKASKTYVTKDVRVDDFTKVEMAGSFDVVYTQEPGRPKVEIYAPDNIVNLLDVYVKGSTLHLGFKKNYRITYNKLQIRLSSAMLEGVSLSGSGSFSLPEELKVRELNLAVTGSGELVVNRAVCTRLNTSVTGSGTLSGRDIVCTSLEGSITGSGDVELSSLLASSRLSVSVTGSGTFKIDGGEAAEAAYGVTGSGDILAAGLKVSKVDAQISGSGDIECHAVDFLKIRVSGSGDVGYKGNPQLDVPKRNYHKL